MERDAIRWSLFFFSHVFPPSRKGTGMTGTVKWFSDQKGYGFITGDDGQEVFVHWTALDTRRERASLREGERVAFETIQDAKGIKAVNVRRMR
jgi:CspA family cold shock protein